MEVGEQHQIRPEETEFLGLGLLHLHHQVGGPGLLAAYQPGPRGAVVVVGDADPMAGACFHPHLHPLAHQLPHAVWGEGHPLLIALDLGGHTDRGHR